MTWCSISATRERVSGEVIPESAEHSKASGNKEEEYGAANVIDLDLSTGSYIISGSDGTSWLKVKLAKTHCIKQVIWYTFGGDHFANWICSNTDCTDCRIDSSGCKTYTLTVSSERSTVDDSTPHTDCKYGDTVTLRRPGLGDIGAVNELGITAKQGEIWGTGVWDIL